MRFSSYINNQRCLEWGLNANQGALFDLLNQASSWAKEVVVNGGIYYWVSRNEIIKELPLFYSKPDTVYRHFVALDEKDLIEYRKHDGKDLIRLTAKGKTWNEFNSEIDPNNAHQLGNKSEKTRIEIRKNSEIDPTNNNTNNKNTNDHINSSSEKNSDGGVGKKSRFKFSDDDMTVAQWIFGLVQKLHPNVKVPPFENWANDIRLMRERDGRTHREICELFQWANQDPFWKTNILSPAKLREKWDQLTVKKNNSKPLCKTVSELNAIEWNTEEGWRGML
ncbi:helix-turn-helix domain-containing protein [Avibacterium avium]|uniref:helix-turn-helix domain-containing protein n=1 Tax=Avibacterium avium TaxID=751 RepID=UPI003BF80EEC